MKHTWQHVFILHGLTVMTWPINERYPNEVKQVIINTSISQIEPSKTKGAKVMEETNTKENWNLGVLKVMEETNTKEKWNLGVLKFGDETC